MTVSRRDVCQRSFIPGRLTRRGALGTGVGLALSALLAACGASAPAGRGSGPVAGRGTNQSPLATPTPGQFLGIFPRPPPPSATPTPVPLVVRFAHWETGTTARRLSEICDRFASLTPHVRVQIETAPYGVYFDRLLRGSASGDRPDVFISSGAYFQELLDRRVVLDLTSLLTRDHLDLSTYWTEPTTRPVNGRQYSLPVWNATEVVFYNADHFAERRLPEPPEDWSWAQLLAVARELTVGKPGEVVRWGLLLVDDLPGGWGSFVASNGGTWLDASGQKTVLDEPASLEAIRWCVEAITVHHVAPRPIQQQLLSQAGRLDLFLAGTVSLFPTGTWEMPGAVAQTRVRWDIRRLPRAPRTGRGVTLSEVQPVSATALTALPDQSWELLHFLVGPLAQSLLARGKLKLPALKAVAADASTGYAAPPPAHAVAAVEAMDDARDLHFVPRWQAFRSAVVQALEPAFDGRIPVEEAVREAVAAGDQALAGRS